MEEDSGAVLGVEISLVVYEIGFPLRGGEQFGFRRDLRRGPTGGPTEGSVEWARVYGRVR